MGKRIGANSGDKAPSRQNEATFVSTNFNGEMIRTDIRNSNQIGTDAKTDRDRRIHLSKAH